MAEFQEEIIKKDPEVVGHCGPCDSPIFKGQPTLKFKGKDIHEKCYTIREWTEDLHTSGVFAPQVLIGGTNT